jgi:uncharacterized protein YbbK (DUF523 family)
VKALVAAGKAIPFCPEQLGGLATPREPSEIRSDDSGCRKVFSRDGRDLTAAFLKGAREGLKLAELTGAAAAVLKERSPSCGLRRVYGGRFDGELISGEGMTTWLFKSRGIPVFSEEEEEAFLRSGLL